MSARGALVGGLASYKHTSNSRRLRHKLIRRPPSEAALIGRKVMEWFSQKTSIAGVQIPNWGIVLGAAVVILLIYSTMH